MSENAVQSSSFQGMLCNLLPFATTSICCPEFWLGVASYKLRATKDTGIHGVINISSECLVFLKKL